VAQKERMFFQIPPISKTRVPFTTHLKNMRSFCYPFQKHVFFLLPISKTCCLFTAHFKNMLSFYYPFQKHLFFCYLFKKQAFFVRHPVFRGPIRVAVCRDQGTAVA
jgi:hypothetical protein